MASKQKGRTFQTLRDFDRAVAMVTSQETGVFKSTDVSRAQAIIRERGKETLKKLRSIV
jgi:hypothetical protein